MNSTRKQHTTAGQAGDHLPAAKDTACGQSLRVRAEAVAEELDALYGVEMRYGLVPGTGFRLTLDADDRVTARVEDLDEAMRVGKLMADYRTRCTCGEGYADGVAHCTGCPRDERGKVTEYEFNIADPVHVHEFTTVLLDRHMDYAMRVVPIPTTDVRKYNAWEALITVKGTLGQVHMAWEAAYVRYSGGVR